MSRISYEQALEDHTYLWDFYGPADDMTGGYVDQGDLSKLLRNPSKVTARQCLLNQIGYWFDVGPDKTGGIMSRADMPTDARLLEIAERYGHDLSEMR